MSKPESAPRTQRTGVFVTIGGRRFACSSCVKSQKIDLERSNVYVWEAGSHGWTGPVRCSTRSCKRPIHVVIDG